jgi:4-alpha-glucanotransferase
MKINFYLRFSTRPGQSLLVTGNTAELGNNQNSAAVLMSYLNDEFWTVAIDIPLPEGTSKKQAAPIINYRYILLNEDGELISEWGKDRLLQVTGLPAEEIMLVDTWNHAGEAENAFYTQPFREVLLHTSGWKQRAKEPKIFSHEFRVKAPLLKDNEILCITGSANSLGNWSTEAVQLMQQDGNWWRLRADLAEELFPITYKYGIYNTKEEQFISHEGSNNRVLYNNNTRKTITILHDGFAALPNNTWRGAGVAIPVFSLRSKNSFGVGEFPDIKLLVDWAKQSGLKLVQLLPVNDTTATHSEMDSYPYAAISAFALHPLFLNLDKVAGKKHAAIVKPLQKKQKQLNSLPVVDYVEVMKFKFSAIRELYAADNKAFMQEEGYKTFFADNAHWLIPYAAFCYLREKNGTVEFATWKTNSEYDAAAIEKLSSPKTKYYNDIAVHYFTQYHLHLQLKDAANYAHKNNVILKGDIPIGIYRYGCDAWMEPHICNLDMQAGAPPDDFAIKGQNWGFPTYNWSAMQQDDFIWWRRRFEQMSAYFDAFRIDHILGFFRIWSIPMHAVEGIMGHFVPAIPVHINEFNQRGTWFDHYRYTQPFITDDVLNERFGDEANEIRNYLDSHNNGQYSLKPAFATQRQVENHFAKEVQNDFNNRMKFGLFDLISNVILFEEEGSQGQRFHFRIMMDNTISFRYLEGGTKEQLKNLYVDYFFRRQDDFWRKEALHKLPELKRATDMLVCGEDLGMVPHCVPDVMKQLGILSLEIQRMPKDLKSTFFHPADAPYLSVVTPSTHDMSTIRGWWEEDQQRTGQFYNQVMGQSGGAPFYCEAWINKAILLQHLYSPAMWSIFQLQDLLGMSDTLRRDNPNDERINVPANPKHYWQYRMHMSLEDLIKETEFNSELRQYVEASGRA